MEGEIKYNQESNEKIHLTFSCIRSIINHNIDLYFKKLLQNPQMYNERDYHEGFKK